MNDTRALVRQLRSELIAERKRADLAESLLAALKLPDLAEFSKHEDADERTSTEGKMA